MIKNVSKFLAITPFIVVAHANYANGQKQAKIPLELREAREQTLSELALKQLERKNFPFNESQISRLKEEKESYERFLNEDIRDPDVQSRTVEITPSVAQKEELILSSANFTTNLVFVDSLGNPWPISKIVIGAVDYFTVDQYLEHAVMIVPKVKYKKTNLTVILKGMEKIPIVFSLKEDKDLVDYIVQAKIAGFAENPNGSTRGNYQKVKRNVANNTGSAEEFIQLMNDNITPPDSVKLSVIKNGQQVSTVTAWQHKRNYYVRTKGELIIPDGRVMATSVDNYKLYEIPPIGGLMIEENGVINTNIKLIKEEMPSYEDK